jgi:hypothetical protein
LGGEKAGAAGLQQQSTNYRRELRSSQAGQEQQSTNYKIGRREGGFTAYRREASRGQFSSLVHVLFFSGASFSSLRASFSSLRAFLLSFSSLRAPVYPPARANFFCARVTFPARLFSHARLACLRRRLGSWARGIAVESPLGTA